MNVRSSFKTNPQTAKLMKPTVGASAPLKDLVKKFGFTPDHVVAAAKEQLELQAAAMGVAMSTPILWKRFQQYLCEVRALGLTLDVSRMRFEDGFFDRMAAPVQRAFEAMDVLEHGGIANPDENRMVGHYWLRAPHLAPSPTIAAEISSTLTEIKRFAEAVHDGTIRTPAGVKFTHVLSIGIGGSALGPMFVADALGNPSSDAMNVNFIDNTDPDGIARILHSPAGRIHETLCIVVSKSGGTPEPRNAMLLVHEAFRKEKLDFPKHAVAVTMPGSKLDRTAQSEGWLRRFPMFDWVGGRTSVLSAVGLLPAALRGSTSMVCWPALRRATKRRAATICGQTPPR